MKIHYNPKLKQQAKRGIVRIDDFFSDENNPLAPFINGETQAHFITGEEAKP
ncbi:hypothetical protein B188_18000 [Candidatus Brocadiaceae bacterium B188]|nr:hypothetical protein [Candidatus Brocadia sapporoensis]QQR66843.1 MAG: hypothetical protein IPI25_00835 [Candidatus Brocadia sp.]TWU53818.1 hypothetical protein B188_18000 [Candidatus Brocadiaceae bacterium B188]